MIGSTAIGLAWAYWVLYRKETKEFFRIVWNGIYAQWIHWMWNQVFYL
jgi:hypothetical protein